MKLAGLVDPTAEDHRVPLRFVRWEEPVVGEPLTLGDPRFDTRQAVLRFLGENADPLSSSG